MFFTGACLNNELNIFDLWVGFVFFSVCFSSGFSDLVFTFQY